MKYALLLVVAITFIGCMVSRKVMPKGSASASLELVSGEWIETQAFHRLKEGDISEPHPFNSYSSSVNILTCYKDGQPYFRELNGSGGFLEAQAGHYRWRDDRGVKIDLQFSVDGTDTLVTYTYQHRDNEPFSHSLSRIPKPTPCDFEYYPGKDLRSGYAKCYNQFYFEGAYEVTEAVTNNLLAVELSPDFKVSGLSGVDGYSIHTYCYPLVFRLYHADTAYQHPIVMEGKEYARVSARNEKFYAVSPQRNGFDLHQTNCKDYGQLTRGSFTVKEKVYTFRRK